MIKSYLAEIQLRLQTLNQLLGQQPQKNEQQIRSINDKLKQFSNKLQKDIKVKYQKIKRFTDNYHQVVDLMLTSDKVNIVVDQLEQLKQTTQQLDKIQKLLPVLNSDQYIKIKSHYNNLYLLASCSQVKMENNSIELVKYNPTPLQEIRDQHRCQMNSLIQLNQRIVNNLGQKLKAAHKRRIKK